MTYYEFYCETLKVSSALNRYLSHVKRSFYGVSNLLEKV